MVDKYYIAIRPQTNEYHSVHKAGCPFLPEQGKRVDLGSFQSPLAALAAGHKLFSKSKSCIFCSKDQMHAHNEYEMSASYIQPQLISPCHIKATWESALKCSVN